MAEIFSDEWLKSSVATKHKTFGAVSGLDKLYALIFTDSESLKDKLEHEITELGLYPVCCQDLVEAKKSLNKYGSKIVMILSGFDLSDQQGRIIRELVLENTNDTPFAILTDLNPFEIDTSNHTTQEGKDLSPHCYLNKSLSEEAWHNFLRFDVLTKISLLGEEVKLRGAFIQNAESIIQNTEELVLSLEDNAEPTIALDSIFGNIHTLKGGSSFLQPKNLERFMHQFEDLINKMRSGEIVLTSDIITSMLKALDKSKELIEDLEAHFHREYEEGELAAYFNFFSSQNSALDIKVEEGEKTIDSSFFQATESLDAENSWTKLSEESSPGESSASSDPLDSPTTEASILDFPVVVEPSTVEPTEIPIADFSSREPMVEESPKERESGIVANIHTNDPYVVPAVATETPSFADEILTMPSLAPVAPRREGGGEESFKSIPPSSNNNRKKEDRKKDDKNLKVPIALLDTLMHISGELTVVRNMINKIDRSLKLRYNGDRELERMSSLLEELHKLNGSLQTHILDLRKVPVKDLVAPLNRVVRDLSKQLDKIVILKVQGAELRIDTAIAEILNNTLIHIVRNSIDHGLESTNERVHKGKPQAGILTIEAFEENDNVYVRLKDDGRGLQTEKISERAIDRGLITKEQATLMKDEDVWSLIFAPGFSTAEKVTDISGRGIGMSAVKEAVEAIGGEVEIASVPEQGSSITLAMPMPKSVLITRCLFILISGMQLGIPNENVYRIVHLDGETDTVKLTKIEDTYILSLEDELIPVVQLDQILGTSKTDFDESRLKTITVLRSSKGEALGIFVDDVLEFEDAVVKPFTDHLKAFDIFFGSTFLGDGSIGLIFRVDGLVETFRIKQFYRFNINSRSRENYLQDATAM